MTVGAERNDVNFGTEWNKRTFALQALRKGLVESGGKDLSVTCAQARNDARQAKIKLHRVFS
jgi:hypothetical protein